MSIIQLIMKRHWEKADRAENKQDRQGEILSKLETLSEDVGHVKAANKAILSDRIRYLGERYLTAAEISFEDRRNLHNLHEAYHDHSGGNGDYDILMREIDELPLKHG